MIHPLFRTLLVSYGDFAYAQIFPESVSGYLGGTNAVATACPLAQVTSSAR
jgi:hypothetical protein